MLGVATTLAVAWGAAIVGFVPVPASDSDFRVYVLPGGQRAIALAGESRGVAWSMRFIRNLEVHAAYPKTVELEPSFGLGPTPQLATRIETLPSDIHPPPAPVVRRVEFHFGWPIRAMWAVWDLPSVTEGPVPTDRETWELWPVPANLDEPVPFIRDAGMRLPERGAIPTGILPRGFALNTGFYAGSWLLLLSLPAALRHTLRRRRAQCQSCGYPRASLTPAAACPECGAS